MMEQNRHSLPGRAAAPPDVSGSGGFPGPRPGGLRRTRWRPCRTPAGRPRPPVRRSRSSPRREGAFSVNFIDVGQALSVLITCDGPEYAVRRRQCGGRQPGGVLSAEQGGQPAGIRHLQPRPRGPCGGPGGGAGQGSRRGTSTPRWPRPIHSAFRTSSSTPSSRAWRWRCPPWAPAGSWAAPPCRSSGRWLSMTTPTTPPWWCGSTTARPASC